MRLLFVILACNLHAQSLSDSFFEERIRPTLSENCYACHSDAAASGLRADSREGLLKGGKLGPAIVPGDPDRSILVQVVSHTHARLRMPPNSTLKEKQIEALRQWIRADAPWPANAGSSKPHISALDKLQPVTGSIDTFAKPASQTHSRETLIRRLSIDLTGLPPTYEEVRAFVGDKSPDAYRTLVDKFLTSPHYGERWGRYWLDTARYAEDDVRGLGQATYPNAWRYRDWVIQSFNEDLSYDQFIRLQIAADLSPRPGKDDRAALGLFGLGPWYYSNAPPPESRADERHDRVDVLTRGFLGLTVACARCHDHKFDPIKTSEYYAIAAVFARTQYAEIPLVSKTEVEKWEKQNQHIEELEKSIKDFLLEQGKQLSLILARDTARYLLAATSAEPQANSKQKLDPETLERWKKYLARKTQEHPFLKQFLAKRDAESAAAFQEMIFQVLREKTALDEDNEAALAPTKPKKNAAKTRLPNGFSTYDEFCPGCSVVTQSLDRDRYMLWSDLFKTADKKGGGLLFYGSEEIERFLQGTWKQHLIGLRADLEQAKHNLPPQYPFLHVIEERADAPQLRIHLRGNAYNLGDPAPRQFLSICGGQPLTEGSGRKQLAEAIAQNPIAARVAVNRIWGRLTGEYIVGSPSNFGALGEAPKNKPLLEHLASSFAQKGYSFKNLIREIVLSKAYQNGTPRRRLDAEAIRDSMLKVSGLLDETIGGASVDISKDLTRRSVYGRVSRFQLDDSLSIFDFPSPSITAEKRNVTHVPQQQLFFLNSPFSAAIAQAIAKKTKDPRVAYRMILSRDPSASEVNLANTFLAKGEFAEFAQVLLSSNEFLFLD